MNFEKNILKRKHIVCILFFTTMLFGCSTEILKPTSDSDGIIDFNINTPFNGLTENEKILYAKAKDLMDSHIELRNGQYFIKNEFSDNMGMSQEIFNHFRNIMDNTNETIKDLEIVSVGNRYFTTNTNPIRSMIRLKSSSESGGGGIDDVVGNWYGFDVYLSQLSLLNLSTANQVAA